MDKRTQFMIDHGMTDKVTEYLVNQGFTLSQAQSKTAKKLVEFFTKEGDKASLLVAEAQLKDIQDKVGEAEQKLNKINKQFDEISKALIAVADAEEKYGELTDARAKNAITLYASIIKLNEEIDAPSTESVVGAGYILYAYLNGQDIKASPFYKRGTNMKPSASSKHSYKDDEEYEWDD